MGEDQSPPEAHLHPENSGIDCCSIAQAARDTGAVVPAKPFTESLTHRFAGVMHEQSRRPIGCREDFHHFDFNRGRPILKHPSQKELTAIHLLMPSPYRARIASGCA